VLQGEDPRGDFYLKTNSLGIKLCFYSLGFVLEVCYVISRFDCSSVRQKLYLRELCNE
jgi:hypothetical protein